MLDKSASTTRRCENRYIIEDCDATHVTISYRDGEGQRVQHGQLADLSTHGVRISLDARLGTGLHVDMRIRVPNIKLDVTWQATVRWLQPRDAESWWIGCELHDPVPVKLVHDLAMANLLNRRRDPRYEISYRAQAKWELADEAVDVKIVNYSKGGFCMLYSETTSFPNERVMLFLPTDDGTVKIPARVMWQRQFGERYALGCAFSTIDGFVQFRDVVEPGHAENRRLPFTGPLKPMSLTRWVAITILVLMSVKSLEMISRKSGEANENALQRMMHSITSVFSPPAREDSAENNEAESQQ